MKAVKRRNSLIVMAISAAIVLAASPAWANITWRWSFESESGSFVTDGAQAGWSVPAGSYTVDPDTFTVDSSFIPSLVGADFIEWQPTQGFLWDGTSPTQFWRFGGVYTNGMNLSGPGYWYGFDVPNARFYDDTGDYYFVLFEGPLTLEPLIPISAPVPGGIGLAVVGLLSLRRFRRR